MGICLMYLIASHGFVPFSASVDMSEMLMWNLPEFFLWYLTKTINFNFLQHILIFVTFIFATKFDFWTIQLDHVHCCRYHHKLRRRFTVSQAIRFAVSQANRRRLKKISHFLICCENLMQKFGCYLSSVPGEAHAYWTSSGTGLYCIYIGRITLSVILPSYHIQLGSNRGLSCPLFPAVLRSSRMR